MKILRLRFRSKVLNKIMTVVKVIAVFVMIPVAAISLLILMSSFVSLTMPSLDPSFLSGFGWFLRIMACVGFIGGTVYTFTDEWEQGDRRAIRMANEDSWK